MSSADLDTSGTTAQPMWEDDKNTKNCAGCEAKFTMTRRKHHCRVCGRIFCDTCSNHRDELPESFELKGPQRTCDLCHLNLQKTKEQHDPTSVPSRPDPAVVRKEILETVNQLKSEPEDSWVLKVDKRRVVLHAKKIKDSSLVCVRSTVTINAPFGKVFAIYNDKDAWRKWQPELLKCKTIEETSDTIEYIYILYKVPVLNNRDVLIFSEMLPGTLGNPKQSNAVTLVSKSVQHPLCPPAKGCVRAIINVGCTEIFEVEVDGKKQTRITTLFHTDPRGIVHPRIVNATIGKGAGQMADMAAYMEAQADVAGVDALLSRLKTMQLERAAEDAAPAGHKVALV